MLPFRKSETGRYEYALFRRRVEAYWQTIAGGGEGDERPMDAALRETFEEAGIANAGQVLTLATMTMVPVYHFKASTDWPSDLLVIPVYYFACEVDQAALVLSDEHSEYCWVEGDAAEEKLHWDSDKTALWELRQRLSRM